MSIVCLGCEVRLQQTTGLRFFRSVLQLPRPRFLQRVYVYVCWAAGVYVGRRWGRGGGGGHQRRSMMGGGGGWNDREGVGEATDGPESNQQDKDLNTTRLFFFNFLQICPL